MLWSKLRCLQKTLFSPAVLGELTLLLLGQRIACHRLSGDSMTDSSRCPAQELLKAGHELLGGAVPGCSAQLDGVLSLCQKNYRCVGDGWLTVQCCKKSFTAVGCFKMEEYWTERERKREVLELFICTLSKSALPSLSLKVRLIKDALHVSDLQCRSIAATQKSIYWYSTVCDGRHSLYYRPRSFTPMICMVWVWRLGLCLFENIILLMEWTGIILLHWFTVILADFLQHIIYLTGFNDPQNEVHWPFLGKYRE